jgi:hypothetical protein
MADVALQVIEDLFAPFNITARYLVFRTVWNAYPALVGCHVVDLLFRDVGISPAFLASGISGATAILIVR